MPTYKIRLNLELGIFPSLNLEIFKNRMSYSCYSFAKVLLG